MGFPIVAHCKISAVQGLYLFATDYIECDGQFLAQLHACPSLVHPEVTQNLKLQPTFAMPSNQLLIKTVFLMEETKSFSKAAAWNYQ